MLAFSGLFGIMFGLGLALAGFVEGTDKYRNKDDNHTSWVEIAIITTIGLLAVIGGAIMAKTYMDINIEYSKVGLPVLIICSSIVTIYLAAFWIIPTILGKLNSHEK